MNRKLAVSLCLFRGSNISSSVCLKDAQHTARMSYIARIQIFFFLTVSKLVVLSISKF